MKIRRIAPKVRCLERDYTPNFEQVCTDVLKHKSTHFKKLFSKLINQNSCLKLISTLMNGTAIFVDFLTSIISFT